MIGRLMAPAIDKMAAIDMTNFIFAIVLSEHAIKCAIYKIKDELFGKNRGGS
jgi:hypothetical protein